MNDYVNLNHATMKVQIINSKSKSRMLISVLSFQSNHKHKFAYQNQLKILDKILLEKQQLISAYNKTGSLVESITRNTYILSSITR